MTQKNNAVQPPQTAVLRKRMLIGAAVAFVLISIFLLGAGPSKPEWGRFWMVKPLIMVPVAGAAGGSVFYVMDYLLGYKGGWKKAIAIIISVICFVVILWIGTVLGLNGTHWD